VYISLRYPTSDGIQWKHYVLFTVTKTEDVWKSKSRTRVVRFEVLITVTVNIVFWDVTPFSFMGGTDILVELIASIFRV
jgi:hypothetical protein